MIIFLLLGGVGYLGYNFYTVEYPKKVSDLEKQSDAFLKKVDFVKDSVDNLRFTIESMDSQFKNYTEELLEIEDKLNLNEAQRKQFIEEVTEVKDELLFWQKKYTGIIVHLQNKVNSLDGISKSSSSQEEAIDLGQIEVER